MIKPYYSESGKSWDNNGIDENPMFLEVKNGNHSTFYKYHDGEFRLINKNPFKGNYNAVLTDSTYIQYDNDNSNQILTKKV